MPNNPTMLAKAVQHLYGTGAIKKDKDIADLTGYNKTTVSSYINGKIEPSAEFIRRFEQKFKIKIADFREGGPLETIKADDSIQLLTERVLQLFAIARVNQSLLTEVLANQTGKTVLELHRVVSAAMDDELKQILSELRRGQ